MLMFIFFWYRTGSHNFFCIMVAKKKISSNTEQINLVGFWRSIVKEILSNKNNKLSRLKIYLILFSYLEFIIYFHFPATSWKAKKKSNQSNCNSFHFRHILPPSICCQRFKWSQCTRRPLIRRCLCSSRSPAPSLARRPLCVFWHVPCEVASQRGVAFHSLAPSLSRRHDARPPRPTAEEGNLRKWLVMVE